MRAIAVFLLFLLVACKEDSANKSITISYGSHPREAIEYSKYSKKPAVPLMIFIHGGGLISGPTMQQHLPDALDTLNPWNASHIGKLRKAWLVDHGNAFMLMKYPLITYRDSDFEKNSYTIKDVQKSIGKAIDYVIANASQLGIDPSQIYIVAESGAGLAAANYIYTHSDTSKIKGLVMWYAHTDMVQYTKWMKAKPCYTKDKDFCSYFEYIYFLQKDAFRNKEVEWKGDTYICNKKPTADIYNWLCSIFGTNNLNDSLLMSFSPKYLLNEKHNIPTLIQHGNDDRSLPYYQTNQAMDSVFAQYPNKHKILLYDHFDHGWLTPNKLLKMPFYDLDYTPLLHCDNPQFTEHGNIDKVIADLLYWIEQL